MAATAKNTYGQILKSSALIGASSALTIVVRVVRTKVMAILLGPAGVGLLGLYGSIVDLAASLAGMGVNQSGVRQIAQAVGEEDADRISLTVRVVRRTALTLGALGSLAVALFAGPITVLTFGNDQNAQAVALLACALFLQLAGAAETAILQGTRRIADLARVGVWTAVLGTLAAIPLIYFYREDGIVPSIIATALATLLASWWYSRRIELSAAVSNGRQIVAEANSLLKLGFAFMITGLMVMGSAYAIRIIVLREIGVEAAGLYQAAWVIGGLYVGFILQAMGTDFYPRLAAVAQDDAECTRLVNEQTLVSLLIAGPGVLATLTLTPLVVVALYSAKFEASIEALRWICLGMSLRVITWPLGFIVVARGQQSLFIGIDLACTTVHLGLAWLGVRYMGLDGAGMAFFGMYVFHALITYPIARRVCGFRWSRANLRVAGLFIPLIGLVFVGLHVLPSLWGVALGLAAVGVSAVYSLRTLMTLVSPERLPSGILKILRLLRLVDSEAPQ